MNYPATVKTVAAEAAETKARIDAIDAACHALGISPDLPVTQRCLALVDRVGNLVHQSKNFEAIHRHSIRCEDLQVRVGVLEVELKLAKDDAKSLTEALAILRNPAGARP